MSEPREAARRRRENGLRAPAYRPLVEVDPQFADEVLDALRRARIAAYLEDPAPPGERERLFVAEDERIDARAIVAAAIRPASANDPEHADAAFAELVGDW